MKKIKNLYPQILAWENLLLAAELASKGKRNKKDVILFNKNLQNNLVQIQGELEDFKYVPGRYKEFYIYEKKKRKISAAPFRDRVVHHALCNVMMPYFEKSFIDTSFANRKGKGTHKAVYLAQKYMRKNQYYIKCDVRKFFPSIDHAYLKDLIKRKIGCSSTFWLINQIIDYSNVQDSPVFYFPFDNLFTPLERRKGLPIGNLTSQYFANIYLNPLDHYVREKLKCSFYIRYVDDFLLFGNEKKALIDSFKKISLFLKEYRLLLHENTQAIPARRGLSFLGYRIWPWKIRLQPRNLILARRRIKNNFNLYRKGALSRDKLICRVYAWLGHLKPLANKSSLLRVSLGI